MMYRTYTIRLKPSKKQTKLLNETIATIQDFRKIYFEELRYIKDKSNGELIDIAISMNKNLLHVDGDIIYSELSQLSSLNDDAAYINKFEFTTNYCKYIDSVIEILTDKTLFIPLIGYIRYYNPRNLEIMEKIISIRVTKTIDGNFYAGLLFTRTPSKSDNSLSLEKSLALDYSSPNLYIDDKGRTPNKPTLFRNYSKELSDLQWKLHKTKDNKNLHK